MIKAPFFQDWNNFIIKFAFCILDVKVKGCHRKASKPDTVKESQFCKVHLCCMSIESQTFIHIEIILLQKTSNKHTLRSRGIFYMNLHGNCST